MEHESAINPCSKKEPKVPWGAFGRAVSRLKDVIIWMSKQGFILKSP